MSTIQNEQILMQLHHSPSPSSMKSSTTSVATSTITNTTASNLINTDNIAVKFIVVNDLNDKSIINLNDVVVVDGTQQFIDQQQRLTIEPQQLQQVQIISNINENLQADHNDLNQSLQDSNSNQLNKKDGTIQFIEHDSDTNSDDEENGEYDVHNDIDEDGDENISDKNNYDEEYRPLKKRRLMQRRKMMTTQIVEEQKPNQIAFDDQHNSSKTSQIKQAKLIIYKLCHYQSIMNRMNLLLNHMNDKLIENFHQIINNDDHEKNDAANNDKDEDENNVQIETEYPLIDNESLIPFDTLMKLLFRKKTTENQSNLENFHNEYKDLQKQYQNCIENLSKINENNFDDDNDHNPISQIIDDLILDKRKFSLFDLIDSNDFITQKSMEKCESIEKNDTQNEAIHVTMNLRGRKKLPTAATVASKKTRKHSTKSIKQLDDDESMIKCRYPNCTYNTKREWAMNEHINLIHIGVRQFACKVDQCSSMFFTSSELDNHMKKYHADIASKEFMKCKWPNCNKLFKSRLGLRTHLNVHENIDSVQCEWSGCNYIAKNKRQYENHVRKHTGDRPFHCDFPGCQSKFRTNDSLRHHRNTHSELRPFRCGWSGCEATFKTNRGLIIHRALHTGEKLFKCDHNDCDFATERKYHLDLHIYEKHTHIKPFRCTFEGCDSSFLRKDKLQYHLKVHRQEKTIKCLHPLCCKYFVEKGNMMKHYNNKHNKKLNLSE